MKISTALRAATLTGAGMVIAAGFAASAPAALASAPIPGDGHGDKGHHGHHGHHGDFLKHLPGLHGHALDIFLDGLHDKGNHDDGHKGNHDGDHKGNHDGDHKGQDDGNHEGNHEKNHEKNHDNGHHEANNNANNNTNNDANNANNNADDNGIRNGGDRNQQIEGR